MFDHLEKKPQKCFPSPVFPKVTVCGWTIKVIRLALSSPFAGLFPLHHSPRKMILWTVLLTLLFVAAPVASESIIVLSGNVSCHLEREFRYRIQISKEESP